MASKPILSSIPAFDADFGTDEAPILSFSLEYGSYIARKNRVIIREYDTGTEVYNCKLTTMKLEHKLHKTNVVKPEEGNIEEQKVSYSLENNKKYIAKIIVYDKEDNPSLESNGIIFYCYKKPTLTFKNFDSCDNSDGVYIVASTSVSFSVEYEQINSLPISSYNFVLQNSKGETLDSSGIKYNISYGELLRWTVGGIEETELENGDLKPDSEYKIICTVETKYGFVVQIEQKFVVKLECSGVGSLIQVENVGDGTVNINSNYKILNVICSNENPKYVLDENGNPYAIDLTNGDYVEFIDGFTMKKPWEIVMRGEFGVGNLVTLRNRTIYPNGSEYITMEGIIARKKITYTTVPYYYFSFTIVNKNGFVHEVRSDYFRYNNDLVPTEVDLSYYNERYTLKAKLLTGSVTYNDIYIVTNDGVGDVEVTFLNDYSIKNTDGNVMLTNYSLALENDGQGNVSLVIDDSAVSYYDVTKNVILRSKLLNVTDDGNGNVILNNVTSVTDDGDGNISITI